MEIYTIRVVCISNALSNLLFDAENSMDRYFGGRQIDATFIKTYMNYRQGILPLEDNVHCKNVLDTVLLEGEVRDNFLRLDEVTRSNYIRFLDLTLLPLFENAKRVELKLSKLKDRIKKKETNRNELIDDDSYNLRIYDFESNLDITLSIIQDVQNIYSRYVRAYNYSTNLDKHNQLSVSGVKLQWNANKRALYDLFAQLTLMDVEPGKHLVGNTIKELARFLADNVEGCPKASTIERELEKMREPQGIEKAKRGRIDLNITIDRT
ncbi:hypothetical protein ACFQ4C_12470 [Larkinella insperata]|uniref:Uncharacterized protein n=1 Tax=Larkinella insperata TaxID=332158 RepID=A0ABW3Q4E6_9BACT|nr:hypothetical protein [Larkinella insperata]